MARQLDTQLPGRTGEGGGRDADAGVAPLPTWKRFVDFSLNRMSLRFSPVRGAGADYDSSFTAPTYRASQPQLHFELRRARRYEHPLGVVVMSSVPPFGAIASTGNGAARPDAARSAAAVYGLLGAFLRNTLRETDILTCMPESLTFAAFLPGVGPAGAEQMLERCREGFFDCAGFDLRGGVAAFPDDGLTVEDILGLASSAWQQACRADIAGGPIRKVLHG